MTMKTCMPIPTGSLLAGAAAFCLTAAIAVAQNSESQETSEAAEMNTPPSVQTVDRVSDRFATFAGSEANATALVNGLVNGTAITLTATANGQTTTTTITPPTGTMSAGDAFTALALAEADLTKLGVTNPTAADIQAALTGGSVTTGSGSTAVTTKLQGILVLDHQGQSFSQIATTLGVNLRTAISTARTATDAGETAETGAEEAMKPLSARATDRIADHFATFAGSEANASALVTGITNGTAITLTTTANGQTTTTMITPPTGPMSGRSAFTALALAEADLTKLGVTNPTAADIQAALVGGTVTTGSGSSAVTTTLQGVLVLSHQGQSFSQIATTLGVNLQTALASARAASDAGETAENGGGEAGRPAISAKATDRVADHFATFAGSEANSTALVNGLRDGTAITLTSTVNGQTVTTTFTPKTTQMGYGNIYLSLALAEADLAKVGITQPTAADIEAALNGGSVTTGSGSSAVTTQLQGVLVLRTQGQGFGQIAQTLGVNMQSALAAAHAATDAGEMAETAAEEGHHPEVEGDVAKAALASAARPNVAAMANHPDVSAAEHASAAANLAATSHPDIPMRPMMPEIPERPEIPQRPEIPHFPQMPGHH